MQYSAGPSRSRDWEGRPGSWLDRMETWATLEGDSGGDFGGREHRTGGLATEDRRSGGTSGSPNEGKLIAGVILAVVILFINLG